MSSFFSSRRAGLAMLAASLVALTGCSDPTGPGRRSLKVKPELIRLAAQGTGPSASASRVPMLAAVNGSPSADGESPYRATSEVTVTSLLFPIREIYLESSTSDASVMIYQCRADSNDGCLVELNGNALENLLPGGAIQVTAGTFDRLSVGMCRHEGQHTARITASATMGGVRYVTRADGTLGTDGAAEPVELTMSGCAATYELLQPIVIADAPPGADGEATTPDDQVIPVRMYYDLRNIAWASVGNDPHSVYLPAGCSVSAERAAAKVAFLCMTYPAIAGTVDDAPPSFEFYQLGENVVMGFFFSATGDHPLAGYARRNYIDGSVPNPLFPGDAPFPLVARNADGSLYVESYGKGIVFAKFLRQSHSGTFVTENREVAYTATRLR